MALLNGSTLNARVALINAVIGTNGGQQLYLSGASSVNATNITIDGSSCPGPCGDTLDAYEASSVRLDGTDGGNTFINAATGENDVLLSGGSSLLISRVILNGQQGAQAIEAAKNSVVALAGGNAVCGGQCNASANGIAVVVDHVSTLVDVPPLEFGYDKAPDQLFGGGQVQLQSTVDLGLGTVSGQPSLSWNTGAGGPIAIAQNSSFRLEGGVLVTGQVTLSQGSNGFFNTSAGGTNVVTSGVVCPFTAIASAHVVAGNTNALSPTPNFATSFLSANPATKQCLPF